MFQRSLSCTPKTPNYPATCSGASADTPGEAPRQPMVVQNSNHHALHSDSRVWRKAENQARAPSTEQQQPSHQKSPSLPPSRLPNAADYIGKIAYLVVGNFHNTVRVACLSFDASALSYLAGAMKHLLDLALLVVSFSAARSGASEAVPRMVRGAAYLEVGRTTRTLGFVCPANGEGCTTRRHVNRRVERCRGKP